MWPIIAFLISSILGFGTGLIGYSPAPGSPYSQNLSPSPYYRACYRPQPEDKITLKWPTDFFNVPDYRPQLNPSRFANLPAFFDSDTDVEGDGYSDCKALLLNSKTTDSELPAVERTFIKVRTDTRISSCKTDELAGPLGSDVCPESENADITKIRHRGTCSIYDYSDLRKVAQITKDNQELEIFWTPFSYNTGCNFEANNNCGPNEDRSRPNLKDFIYVLKKRDAFDENSNPGCPVLWDAGSTNENACSHYFDVYLAEDVYLAAKDAAAPSDPKDPLYYIKNIVENCQEQSYFTPLPDSVLDIPPSFIKIPFLPSLSGSNPQDGKINPQNQIQRINYDYYIWSKPAVFKAGSTNLVKITENQQAVNICSPNSPQGNCYDPVGSIDFRDQNGRAVSFMVFSQKTAPQTFHLVKTTDTAKSYVYMITEKELPQSGRHDPTLQLKSMEFISQNQWTWATPWCKPAIYLYPEKTTELSVKLKLDGQLTLSDPPYDSRSGWQIIAEPNGELSTKNTSQETFPYLYYEADLIGINIPKSGWVWPAGEIASRLSPILSRIGFNQKEIKDFMNYWLIRLQDKPYYFVTLISPDTINQKEKLEFSRAPDTLIRARVVFEGLNAPLSVPPPENIPSFTRRGFTVTDWGGTIIGKSCSDISVK